jgi:hypothetical protein
MRLATFNARAESIATKPMFRDSFNRRRCLMPASGYYEWQDTPSGKQPYYFTRRDGQVMTLAAIHDTWTDRTTKVALRSCSMVITEPNRFVAEMHDRMPVILEAKDFEQWERGDVKDAAALMKPAGEDVLQKWPVSRRVNSSRAADDDAALIDKVELAVCSTNQTNRDPQRDHAEAGFHWSPSFLGCDRSVRTPFHLTAYIWLWVWAPGYGFARRPAPCIAVHSGRKAHRLKASNSITHFRLVPTLRRYKGLKFLLKQPRKRKARIITVLWADDLHANR